MPIERLSGGEILVRPEWYMPEEVRTQLSALTEGRDVLSMLGSEIAGWVGVGRGGGLSPVLLPGFDELSRAVTREAEKLALRFIGSGVGYTPQFHSLIGDILRGFYREASDIFMGRLLDFAKLLAQVETARQAAIGELLGMGKYIMPELYIPTPKETTQIVKEEKPWWSYLLQGLGTAAGVLLGGLLM